MEFRKKQQIVICIIAAVMSGGFMLLRYLPLRAKMKTVKQAESAQSLAIAKGSTQSEQLSALKEQLLQLQTAVGNYEANIPAQRDLGVFLQKIANLMNEHNLKEQQVQPGSETQAEALKCIPLNIQCKGGLKQIFEFYKSLQKLDRLVRIDQVKLVNDSDFGGKVAMQTKAIIYYQPDRG